MYKSMIVEEKKCEWRSGKGRREKIIAANLNSVSRGCPICLYNHSTFGLTTSISVKFKARL